jgi:hypothetical protein
MIGLEEIEGIVLSRDEKWEKEKCEIQNAFHEGKIRSMNGVWK